jgi:hypothetical protein
MVPVDDGVQADDIETKVRSIIARLAGTKSFTSATSINVDLGIEGDDAVELIEWLHKEFGTSFAGLDMRNYFDDEGIEAVGWFRSRRRPIPIAHIVNVVERGAWFDV